MTHDKFCENNGLGCGEYFCDEPCICDLLAKARADEREQAARWIADLHTRVPGGCADEECCGAVDDYCSECNKDFPCETITIVRGGEQE